MYKSNTTINGILGAPQTAKFVPHKGYTALGSWMAA